MVTIPSFRSPCVQHDVYFVNSRPAQSKIDDIDVWTRRPCDCQGATVTSVRSNQHIVHPLIQIRSPLAPTNQDGKDLNAKLKAWTG